MKGSSVNGMKQRGEGINRTTVTTTKNNTKKTLNISNSLADDNPFVVASDVTQKGVARMKPLANFGLGRKTTINSN